MRQVRAREHAYAVQGLLGPADLERLDGAGAEDELQIGLGRGRSNVLIADSLPGHVGAVTEAQIHTLNVLAQRRVSGEEAREPLYSADLLVVEDDSAEEQTLGLGAKDAADERAVAECVRMAELAEDGVDDLLGQLWWHGGGLTPPRGATSDSQSERAQTRARCRSYMFIHAVAID
jgi:hypothetical protein